MTRHLAGDSPVTSSLNREEDAWGTENEATRPVPQTAAPENLASDPELAVTRGRVAAALLEQSADALNDSDDFHPPY